MDIRQAALKCLIKTLEHDKIYDETYNFYAEKVNNPFELKNIFSGAVKYKLTLDYFIDKISSKKISQLSPEVRNILRLGIFELEFLKRPDYAVVNSYVELCREVDKKAVKFVNAVLRNFIRKKDDIIPQQSRLGETKYLSILYSHPEWLVKKWIKTYGRERAEKICEYNNSPAKVTLRVNTLKISKNDLLDVFTEKNINFTESEISKDCIIVTGSGNIKNIPGFREGFWAVQGESSSLVSEVLAPEPGELVLDFCAAPGTKTTHIAMLMQDKGKITAVDISAERLKKIEENCKRLGVKSIKTLAGDAVKLDFAEKFDRVLIDVPCSNTGVFAGRPDARWKKTPESIEDLSQLQMKILKNAAIQLKPGGILVYSTCSIEPEENELLIKRFIKENKNFTPENFRIEAAFGSEKFPGFLQILQSEHNIDGFFIAKLRSKQ